MWEKIEPNRNRFAPLFQKVDSTRCAAYRHTQVEQMFACRSAVNRSTTIAARIILVQRITHSVIFVCVVIVPYFYTSVSVSQHFFGNMRDNVVSMRHTKMADCTGRFHELGIANARFSKCIDDNIIILYLISFCSFSYNSLFNRIIV